MQKVRLGAWKDKLKQDPTRLTEAYMAIGIVGEAQTAAAVLGHNFPDSRWYKDAYNLVKSGGVEPSENKGSYISKAFKKLGLG